MMMERTSSHYSHAMSERKRIVTKQDVFASPEAESTQESQSQVVPDFTKRTAAEIQVVGFFDELNGVLTPDQARSIEKNSGQKVKLVSLEEASRQAAVEKQAILCSMPEDAGMSQDLGESQGGGNRINQSNQYMLEMDETTENLRTSATTNDASFEAQARASRSQTTPLVDLSLLAQQKESQRSDSEQVCNSQSYCSLGKKHIFTQSTETVRVPMRQQLPPIFERSFEASEMASSLGGFGDQHSFSGSNMQAAAPSFSKSIAAQSNLVSQNMGAENMANETGGASFLTSTPILQEVNHSGSFVSSSQTSPLLSKDEEKWPVSQQQTVIVVTRTYEEQQSKRRKKTVVGVFVFLVILAWLLWALSVVLK